MITRFFRRPPAAAVISGCAILLAATSAADYLSVNEIGYELFYALIVGVASWYLGVSWGLGFSVLNSAVWLVLDVLGREVYWEPTVSFWNGVTRLALFAALAVLGSTLRETMLTSEALKRTDELTGVGNTAAFYEAAKSEIERARRWGGVVTFALFDIDGLDQARRERGGRAAEELLEDIARSVYSEIRTTDVLARLENDQFAVLFPETGRMEAGAVLLKVSDRVLSVLRAGEWDTSLRMGAMTFLTPPDSVQAMRRAADNILKDAGKHGDNVFEHHVRSA